MSLTPPASGAADAASPPSAALGLGYAGLLPFVGGAALVWLVHEQAREFVANALLTYGAAIASFLGGLHWGFGALGGERRAGRYLWGVVPSLLAWVALLMQASAGLVMVGATLVLCFLVDRRAYPPLGLAAWLPLRARLSLVASLSCFLGAAGA